MAVNWQTIEVPFGAGLNTKTNPRRLQAPELEDIQNLVFTEAPGYVSRFGSTEFTGTLSTGGSLSATYGLATHGNQLLLFDDTDAYSYDTVQTEWSALGSKFFLPEIRFGTNVSTDADQISGGSAVIGNLRLVSWVERGQTNADTYISIKDTNTGGFVVDRTAIATGAASYPFTVPQVLVSSSAFYVFYFDSSATAIKYRKIATATPDTIGSATSVQTDCNTHAYHACVDPTDSTLFIFAYARNNGGTPNLSGFVFNTATDTAGTTRTLNSTLNERDIDTVAIGANQTYAFVMACDKGGATTHLTRADLDLQNAAQQDSVSVDSSQVAVAIDTQGVGDWDDTSNPSTFFWEEEGTGNNDIKVNFSHAGTAFSGGSTIFNCGLGSHGFSTAVGKNCIVLTYDSFQTDTHGTQKTPVLMHIRGDDDAAPIGRIFAGVGPAIPSHGDGNEREYHLPSWTESSLDVFEFGFEESTEVVNPNQPFRRYQMRVVTIDFFEDTPRYQAVEYGGTTYIAGGNTLWEYDGSQITENNFLVYPERATCVGTTSGTALEEKTYNYRLYLEWTNAKGDLRRSTFAKVISPTLGTSEDGVSVTAPTIGLTRTKDREDASIVVYRSEADADVSSGAPFYRVTSLDPSDATYLANDLSTATVNFIDNLSDANLISRELDYQNTGELDNVAAPVGGYVAVAKSRLWVTGGINKNVAYYSKLKQLGEAAAFNEALQIVIPDGGNSDGITAIGELNHFVVFFKSESIYVVSGDGPDNLGRGFFNEPQRVTSDVGCSEPRSVVAFDGGLLFKSDKGIYLLGQNLQVEYIGAPVELYNTQDITAATLVNDQNQIRFLTSSGRMLVYDYFVKQWTTFTGWNGIKAVNWRNGDVYVWAEKNGTIHQEDSTTWEDAGVPVDWSLTTAPLNLQGLGGFFRMQRVLFQGDYFSNTNFEVTPYYDGASSGTQAAIATSGMDSNDPFRAVFNLPRQKFSDVKFLITGDRANSGTSQGIELQAMRVKVAHKPGLDKLSAGNKFGD